MAREDPDDRLLKLETIPNFRDYGGWRAAGGVLRRGTLWRSAHHAEASASDLETVAGLGLAAIVDLRGDGERAAQPCRRPPDFQARVVFASGDTAGVAPHIEAAGGALDGAMAEAIMRGAYATMPWRDALVAGLRLYFAELAASEGPTLVHCVAGKDRTGFAVALLHRLLGVSEADAMADYLLTNDPARLEVRKAQVASALAARYGRQVPDDALDALVGVRADYLATAFAAIAERHGSLAAYARDVLGVGDAGRDALARRLLA
ncbi:MAG: tyrosine-protein phosphatase [Sphingomonadaceae bacterium]